MTDAAIRPAGTGAAPVPASVHPLDPVTAEEYRAGRDILARAGLLTGQVRFAYYGLEEPPKAEVLAFAPAAGTGGAADGGANGGAIGAAGGGGGGDGGPVGALPDRRLRAFLVNVVTGESTDAILSLGSQKVLSARTLDPRRDGHLPILDQDFALCEEIVHADEGWRAAMARRGLTDVSKIRACPLTAGHYDDPGEDGRRMVRVLAFVQNGKSDLPWAHPVDGVAAYVDLIERKVFRVIDALDLAVPQESGDYDDPAVRGPLRTGLRPIEITQPDGPSFTLDGQTLGWQGWSMRIGFDAREGLSLHQISLDGRPVVYRASIPEMVVPYGDPSPTRHWQNYFDTGEYLVGKWVNSLERGCDCLGEIAYLPATITDGDGEPREVGNAICIHEEDFGILWKHTDIFTGSVQARRQRRLVVSFFTTVGNYDYGFYWYLYLDGTIECEAKLTGILFTSSFPGDGADGTAYPFASQVAPVWCSPRPTRVPATPTPRKSLPASARPCISTCSAPGST